MIKEPSVDYYRENFQHIIDFVFDLNQDLLHENEKQFYHNDYCMKHDAQCLLVRLLSRKGPVFRSDTLSYEEISDISSAASELERYDFVSINDRQAILEILTLLRKDELCQWGNLPKSLRKADLLLAAQQQSPEGWLTELEQQFAWYTLRCTEIFNLYKLCFFGNAHQDLNEFILHDLDIIRYENYSIDESFRYFQQRSLIDEYVHYYECAQLLEETLAQDTDAMLNLSTALPDTDGPALVRKVSRIQYTIARQLERLAQRLVRTYEEKKNTANLFVNWRTIDLALLLKTIKHIPLTDLLSILQHLLADLCHRRSGFPDLINFLPNGGYQLVEVKAPGDRLQKNQQYWMAFFSTHSIPHFLLQVEWQV